MERESDVSAKQISAGDALMDLCDQLQAAVDEFKRRVQENPNPCGSRALAFAMESGLPPRMAYTVSETAMYTGVDYQQLRREIQAGRLHQKLPAGNLKGARITVDEVDRWMDAM